MQTVPLPPWVLTSTFWLSTTNRLLVRMVNILPIATLLAALISVSYGQDAFTEGEARPQVVSIGRISKPLMLDGNLKDWPVDTTSIVLGSANNGVRRRGSIWTGTRDLSAIVRLAWDDDCLYVAADVCDDDMVQATRLSDVYLGDSLELFFNTHPQQHRLDGFWHIAIAPPFKSGEPFRVFGAQKEFEGIESKTQIYTNGYTLECRIPWKNLTGFVPSIGQDLGFQMILIDRDGKTTKSRQAWYPSALTFAQPAHMNTLILRDHGDTSLPRVAAGPNTWCVTDPDKMPVSVITDAPDAENVTFSLLSWPNKPQGSTEERGPPKELTLALDAIGPRVKVAQGALTGIEDLDGLCVFGVRVTDEQGRVMATSRFEAELSARPYARISELAGQLPKRLDALAKKPDVDPMVREGLTFWMRRCNALLTNEARIESTSRRLLDQVLEEMNALDVAITRCQNGGNPYQGLTGSFVKAYTSPLTGQPKPIALLVPKDYDAGKPWPLIVILHSMYADDREVSLMAWRLRDLEAVVCLVPSYRQFDWGGINAAETWAGLDEVRKLYAIDPDRIYLMGHSIGGRGTWQLAEARPDVWAACAPMISGSDTGPTWSATRLYPQYYPQAIDPRVSLLLYHSAEPDLPKSPQPFKSPVEKQLLEQASMASRVENIVALPLHHSYGDETSDGVAERLAMLDRFIELGSPVATHYVPGAAHGSFPEEWNTEEFYQWLLSNRRPPIPLQVTFVANGLRYNEAWWVRVDQLMPPSGLGRINATIKGRAIDVKTSGLSAFSLLPKDESGNDWSVSIDGQAAIGAKANATSFVRASDGQWKPGQLGASEKRHGLSGPMDDFQFGRFMFVYGTQGDEKTNAMLAKLGKQFSDWGLGAVFECKADRDVTGDDMRQKHLLLIGSPQNNSVLAKMRDNLPLKWSGTTLSMGSVHVSGDGAGACFIYPNSLSSGHYVVVITANDEEGYEVWPARGPSDDYLLGCTKTTEGKPSVITTAHGCFDNQWKCISEGCVFP